MPGPGLELVGDEELAELTDVIRMRDDAEVARRQAHRFRGAYLEHVA